MSRTSRRTQLTPGYILHHAPYRDTSRILEVLTREHGRLSLFARGVRGPRSKLAAALQPFQLLLLSFSGRGEAPQLTGAELAGSRPVALLPGAYLMACYYLNELVLKLTTRHDPHPALFDSYSRALEEFKSGAALEPGLRIFEKRLLTELGYGLDLTAESRTGRRIVSGGYYCFRPGEGLVAASPEAPGALAGSSLESLERERLVTPVELADARRLLKAALDHCLEGRELVTRAVAREVLELRPPARERGAPSSQPPAPEMRK
jgi:DNA repair protein RecO (recombination protein O)